MRITKLKIAKSISDKKLLKEVNITGKPLGSTVALIGKNGAGKSRILELVINYFQNITVENLTENHITEIPLTIGGTILPQIDSIKNLLSRKITDQARVTNNNALKQQYAQLLQRFKQIGNAYIKVVDNDDLKEIKASLSKDNNLTFEKLISNLHFDTNIKNPEVFALNDQQLIQGGHLVNEFKAFNSHSTIQYISKLTDSILTDQVNLYLEQPTDLDFINSEIKKNISYLTFNKFQEYVRRFLGKEFTYKQRKGANTISSILHFNGHPFNIEYLSPGQKTLFAYAILFFYLDINSKTNIKESIIIIDEPEKHLHPEAQIALIRAIKGLISESGQLWIATHSINILAHLEYNEILMVKDDEIILPSRTTPGHSFVELMGIETHISELTSFINSISDWAYSNFMVQCLHDPDVVLSNNVLDPQYLLFRDFLTSKNNITLLDFGAGKGRMGYTIAEDAEVQKKVTYSAFEPNLEFQKILKDIPGINMLFSSQDEIPANTFDCVLLCNVLHEINPKNWNTAFSEIKNSLKDDGFLIIIEDKFLPKGERAHEFGYLILDEPELKSLFNINLHTEKKFLRLKMKDHAYEERIVFVVIQKSAININSISIKTAIQGLQKRAFVKIKELRLKGDDVNIGQQYANQTQLYINSQLALDGLKK